MNYRILLLLCSFFFLISAKGQTAGDSATVCGSWQGILVAEGDSQMVVFDVVNTPKFSCFVSFPWIAMEKIEANKINLKNDSLFVKFSSPNFSFKGVVDVEHASICGQFKQGKSFPLTVVKTQNPLRIQRPQTPSPPFDYLVEDVVIHNTKNGVDLSGTLTIPKGVGPFPAVVLISGSGPQNRDEEILAHKPFFVIADYLTKNGIAVLRYDDRGVGKSTGKFKDATTFDFALDADAAFEFLEKDMRINPNKIGLIGHSEGGVIAPIVASKNKKVKFVILLAGTGVNGKLLMLEQYRLILHASSIPDSVIDPLVDLNRKAYNVVMSSKSTLKIAAEIRLATENAIKIIGTENASKYRLSSATAETLIFQLSTPWMRTFLSLDPAKYLKKLRCPILALNGTLDLQVPEKQNIPAIQNAVSKKNKANLTILVFPNLNHLFQTAQTGSPAEYARIEETINPKVLTSILHYITNLK